MNIAIRRGPDALRPAGGASPAIADALEAGLVVMRNGGSTVAADRSFSNLLKGSAKADATAIWRLDFAAAIPGDGQAPLIGQVGGLGVNLVRAAEVAALGERVAKGEVPAATAEAELARIKHLPSPYNRWLVVALAGATAAAFAQIPGGDWGSSGIAFVAGVAGQFVRSQLQSRKVAVAPTMLITATVSAGIAALGLRLGYSQVESATLLASVAYIFPGLPLINGFVDLISHRHLVVGAERILNATFLFLILAIAIAFAHAVVGL